MIDNVAYIENRATMDSLYGSTGSSSYFTSIGGEGVLGPISSSLALRNPTIGTLGGNILQYNSTSRPASGAWIRNRYVDGVLTGDALWPWPMEDRIAAALVASGYDTKGIDGVGGTSVTDTVFELGGGTMPNFTDIVPPAAPQGLAVQ
jgi:hypothetical protein